MLGFHFPSVSQVQLEWWLEIVVDTVIAHNIPNDSTGEAEVFTPALSASDWTRSLGVTIHMIHGLFSFLSHTCSTSSTRLLHYDSYLSHLWLIAPTLTPPLTHLLHYDSSTPICTFTIYTARFPPVKLSLVLLKYTWVLAEASSLVPSLESPSEG